MSISIVLNDATPSPAPTNGCCAGFTDQLPTKASMSVGGAAGSGSSAVNVTNHLVNLTYLYYVGTSGDYNGMAFPAGTWTVPLNVSSLTGTIVTESVYVCQADSTGASKATIGSVSPATNLTSGVNTFSISGSASATFATGDVVVISFQFQGRATGTFNAIHDQTVSAPGAGAGNLPLQPRVIRSEIEPERASIFRTRTAPYIRLIAGGVPVPRCMRFDEPAIPGAIFRTTNIRVINPPRVAGGVPPPRCVRFDEPPLPGAIFRNRVLPITPAPRPGVLILFYRGPKADLPILPQGSPGWCTDTNQLFVGDGFTNHFVGGMASAVPAHTGSAGYPGEYACDGTNLYQCYALNSWLKIGPGSTAF